MYSCPWFPLGIVSRALIPRQRPPDVAEEHENLRLGLFEFSGHEGIKIVGAKITLGHFGKEFLLIGQVVGPALPDSSAGLARLGTKVPTTTFCVVIGRALTTSAWPRAGGRHQARLYATAVLRNPLRHVAAPVRSHVRALGVEPLA